MNEQIHLQNILKQKLNEYRSKNPAFSVRAFAKRLDLQPTPVNQILKGQRRVSRKMAEKIADRLLLDPTERMNLLKDFPPVLKRDTLYRANRSEALQQMKLNAEQFEFVADWVHSAILSMLHTKGFVSDTRWIASRLGVSAIKVQDCVDRLEQLKLIKIEADGSFAMTHGQLNSSDDVLNISVQKSHLNDMEMAKDKMREVEVSLRDFTSFAFAFDVTKMNEVKQAIRRFQDEMFELMQTGKPTEVYKINTYLYPLTKLEKRNQN